MDDHPLRAYRKSSGLTLADLAEKASTTSATISRIEKGQANPSVDMVRRLVQASGGKVSANDLIHAFPARAPKQEAAQ